jgi:purine nucleosidase
MTSDGRNAIVHGRDGLGDLGLAGPGFGCGSQHAVDFIIDRIHASPGKITICPIGPMTNVALALIKDASIAQKVAAIVFMGGAAFCQGNSTPEAEFNIYHDPHAAHVVFNSGIPLTMFGLDVTTRVKMTAERLNAVDHEGNVVARTAAAIMRHYGSGDLCLHDPCVIAYLLDPSLFTGVDARLSVECESPLTRGRTVAAVSDYFRAGMPTNCCIITGVDDARFFAVLTQGLRRL